MPKTNNNENAGLNDLRIEIEKFKQEKEKVRSIVGQIGAIPTLKTNIFQSVMIVLVLACVLISLFSGGTVRLLMIELAVAAVSAKIIYQIHIQSRVNHFQLWILSSLEWRINEIIRLLKDK